MDFCEDLEQKKWSPYAFFPFLQRFKAKNQKSKEIFENFFLSKCLDFLGKKGQFFVCI